MNCCSTLLAVAFAGVYACGLLLGIIFIVIRRGTDCFNVKPQPRELPQQTEQLTLLGLLRGPPERCNLTNDDGSAAIANAFDVNVCIGRGKTSDIFGPVQYKVLMMQPFDPSTAAEEVTLKLSNFSLTYDMNKFNFFNEMLAWTAPEVISEEQFSKYSDTWSYGVTVWEILTSEIPYRESKFGHTVKGLLSGQLFLKIPDSCPPVLRDILADSFNRVPTARPSFSKILTSLGGSSQEC